MINTQTYVRKPLFVEAVCVTSDNFNEIALWCQGDIQEITERGRTFQFIAVRVTNPMNPRQGQARVNDWILASERGYKVYTPKAFEKAFDLAGGTQQGEPVMMPVEVAQGMAALEGDAAALRAEAKDGNIKPEEAEMIAVATEPIVPTEQAVGTGPMPEQPMPTESEEKVVYVVVDENANVVYPSTPETTV